jgi:beta-N-acetylhexosaminidase
MELTLKQKIGQMLMIGFNSDQDLATITKNLEQNLLGNVILYGYNIMDALQLKNLTNLLIKANKHIIIAADQEGGKVQKLNQAKGFTNYPPALEVAALSIPDAYEIYLSMARELKAYGINLNFAPVVDLASPNSEIIGKLARSFSADCEIVTKYAKALIAAHRQVGVFTCIKHFPGHGLVAADSHKTLPDATDTARFEELVPYYELVKEAQVDMIMTAHILNRNLDAKYPATLSPVMIKRLLRARGYEGVVISDDLFMSAIVENYSLSQSVIMSIKAGCDMLIYSNNKTACAHVASAIPNVEINLEIIEIIVKAIKDGDLTQEDIEKSYQRIVKLKNSHSG